MNQTLITEIILGFIAVVKSKLMVNLFDLKQKKAEQYLIQKMTQKILSLDILLNDFYKKAKVSQSEYETLIDKIKSYE